MKKEKSKEKSQNINMKDFTDDELFELYEKNRDIEIRNELVKRNLYIADILSKKYANKGIEYEDIYQVASLALIYAVERFDNNRGFKFSSFATPTIIGEIKRYFRDKGWQLRVPRRVQELSSKVRKAKTYLEQRDGHPPKIKDIADYLDSTEEEILEAIDASSAYMPMSLDLELNSDDSSSSYLHELIGDNDKNIEDIERDDFLDNILETLDETEKKIIYDRFFESKTQSEVAEELGVSQMTISRMEKKILKKLKKEYKKQIVT